MKLRTWARILIALSFSLSGLVETLSATGLVVEWSPTGHWDSGVHVLAIGGPLQLAGAVLLLSGRKTRWALGILGCYVVLASIFEALPFLFKPELGGFAFAGLLSNLAVIGGILYWFDRERSVSSLIAPPQATLETDGLRHSQCQ